MAGRTSRARSAAPNPDSRLRWLQSPALALLEALLAGTLELSHAALDRAQGGEFPQRTVAFLRAALVHHGVLEARDEQSAAFASSEVDPRDCLAGWLLP